MASGHAHPWWSGPQARTWAGQRIGAVETMGWALETCPVGLGEIAPDDGTAGEREDTAGVVCWFHDAGDRIVIGLGDIRYVLEMDPDKPAMLQCQAYQGPALGWQPAMRCPNPLALVGLWSRRRGTALRAAALAMGHGRHLLAGLGPAGVQVLQDNGAPVGLVRAGSRQLEEITLLDVTVEQRACVERAAAWLYRRFARAALRHPNLWSIRAWALVHGAHPDGDEPSRSTAELLLHHLARLAHPRSARLGIHETMAGSAYSPSEARCARVMIEHWCAGDKEMDLSMPTARAMRWWLALDDRSRGRLVDAFRSRATPGTIGALCHLLAPIGKTRLSGSAVAGLGNIDRSWLVAACLQDKGVPGMGHMVGGWWASVKDKIEQHPRTCAAAGGLARLLVQIPAAWHKAGPAGLGSDHVVAWLFADENAPRLGTIDPGRGWRALERACAHWCLGKDRRIDQNLDELAQEWPPVLGRHTRDGYDVIELTCRRQLTLAGRRHANCLRQRHHSESTAMACEVGARRVFLARGPQGDVLIELASQPGQPWQLSQCRGPANRQATSQALGVARALVAACEQAREQGRDPAASGEEVVVDITCQASLQKRLAAWLAGRPGKPILSEGTGDWLCKHEVEYEEVAAADGFLGVLVSRALAHHHRGLSVSVSFTADPRSLLGSAIEVDGPVQDLDRLFRIMILEWSRLERECAPGRPDIGRWLGTV